VRRGKSNPARVCRTARALRHVNIEGPLEKEPPFSRAPYFSRSLTRISKSMRLYAVCCSGLAQRFGNPGVLGPTGRALQKQKITPLIFSSHSGPRTSEHQRPLVLRPSRRFGHQPVTSGLLRTTDIARPSRHVAKVPIAVIPASPRSGKLAPIFRYLPPCEMEPCP
jgi:hypothetical protein